MVCAAFTMVGCSDRDRPPEFEVFGIKLDSATLDAARTMHPQMTRELKHAFLPNYQTCRVGKLDLAKITTTMFLDIDKGGVVTQISLHGEHYDGPFYNYSKAMWDKYGPGQENERGEYVWRSTNGDATLSKTKDGGAWLRFEGKRWQQELKGLDCRSDAIKPYIEKGQRF